MSDGPEGEIPTVLDWTAVTAALEALGIPNTQSLRAVEIDPRGVSLRYLLRTETKAAAVGVVEFAVDIPYRYPDQQQSEGSELCRSPKAETPPGHHASSTPSSPASTPGTPGTPETPTT